ncbi:MAG: hypothetical protein JW827_02085 [Spirochaetes bacterium]|nr:hypothetical protein [Spirochaetota bacterium]
MDKVKQLKDTIKKLEGVFKVTINNEQKKRVKKELMKLKEKLKRIPLDGHVLTEEDNTEEVKKKKVVPEEKKEEETDDKEFPLLSGIKIEKVHKKSDDHEINMAFSYLKNFESELWGAMGDFHLKLDYNHSKERDKFYNHLENVERLLKEYINILNELYNASQEDYMERVKVMKVKTGRAFLVALTEFMKELSHFLQFLLDDYKDNGNIILNPDEEIKFSKLEGKNKSLEGKKIIDALHLIIQFTDEFVRKINIPEEILSQFKK